MSVGEGILLVLGAISGTIVMTVVAVAFLTWFLALMRAHAEQEAHVAYGGAVEGEAYVPELAAAVRPPAYRGPCRCRGCAMRPQEPCSDFDGD